MPPQISYREVTDPGEKSSFCEAITRTLPDWFGIASANEKYRDEIASKTVFAALAGDTPVGAIALRPHFQTSIEIWWMGVVVHRHRQGIGHHLMELALTQARSTGAKMAVLNTLSPASPDTGYASTRHFYEAEGFEPLVNFNEDDRVNPMMWMIKPL